MSDTNNDADGLNIGIGGDDTAYEEMVNKVISETQRMAATAVSSHDDMINKMVAKHKAGAQQIISAQREIESAISGKKSTYNLDKLNVHEVFPELNELKGMLGQVEAAEAELIKTTGGLRGAVGQIGPTAGKLAPWLGMVSTEAEAAAVGIESLAGAAGPLALELGVFALAVGGVTYAISGWEGVMEIPNNMLEGTRMALKFATFGMLDYTEASAGVAASEKMLASSMAAGQAQVQSMLQERSSMIANLTENVKALGDHSVEAEKKFTDAYVGRLGQLGANKGEGKGEEFFRGDAAMAFASARVDDLIKKLEKEAETYGMDKYALAEYTLELNNASDAQREMAQAALDKMKAVDAAKEAEKAAKKEAEEAEREAKRRAEEATREHDKLVKEGEALHKSLRTPLEKLGDEAMHAQELFRKGVISAEDLERAWEKFRMGPKEHEKKVRFKFITESDIGTEARQFGGSEDLLSREAFKENFFGPRGGDMVFKAPAAGGGGGPAPGVVRPAIPGPAAKDPSSQIITLLTEIKTQVTNTANNTGSKKFVTLAPAGFRG